MTSGSILSVTGEIILPTGDADRGFGTGTVVFEHFLTYGQLLPQGFFLQNQAGVEIPVDTDRVEREGFVRAAVGRSFAVRELGRNWSPMVEILGTRELVSGGEFNWDVVPQVQVTLNTRQHIMMNVGVRSPLTNTSSRDTSQVIYLLWEWFDGGFFEGW